MMSENMICENIFFTFLHSERDFEYQILRVHAMEIVFWLVVRWRGFVEAFKVCDGRIGAESLMVMLDIVDKFHWQITHWSLSLNSWLRKQKFFDVIFDGHRRIRIFVNVFSVDCFRLNRTSVERCHLDWIINWQLQARLLTSDELSHFFCCRL